MGTTMAKAPRGPPQKHLHSRISFLHQAARYLSGIAQEHGARPKDSASTNHQHDITERVTNPSTGIRSIETPISAKNVGVGGNDQIISSGPNGLTRLYTAQLRTISHKSTIRLTPEMKHSICKRCDNLLGSGNTSTTYLENKSRNGQKPWADVLIQECNACGATKRFPVGAKRQQRREQGRKSKERKDRNESSIAQPG